MKKNTKLIFKRILFAVTGKHDNMENAAAVITKSKEDEEESLTKSFSKTSPSKEGIMKVTKYGSFFILLKKKTNYTNSRCFNNNALG